MRRFRAGRRVGVTAALLALAVLTPSRAPAREIGPEADLCAEIKALPRGEELVLGHSVERLCAEAGGRDAHFRERARRWSILDSYYVTTRYPNSLPDSIPARVYTQDAAKDAVRLAREIVTDVGERLMKEP